MFSLYILYSPSSNRYYVGISENVDRRLLEHNELSESSYTSKHRPWELKLSIQVGDDVGVAMRIEKFITKQKSKKYIERIIEEGNLEYLIERFSN